MQLIQRVLIFFFISYGIIRIFNLHNDNFRNEIVMLFSPKDESIRYKIELAKGKKKRRGMTQLIYETRQILKLINKQSEFPLVCFSSAVLVTLAILLCLMYGNYFLIAPLCFIAVVSPFAYIRNRGVRLRKLINDELETALSIITNSYIRNENIVVAIEENIDYIHRPIQDIFKSFIFDCDYVSSDIKQNLRKLKNSFTNPVFQEWCSALILCQNDSSLKNTLNSIVKKLSYIRLVSVKLDSVLYEPVREFVFMVIILLFNIPVFYVLNRQWFYILTKTVYGHITVAVVVGIIAFCAANVIRLTKPIEYQR